jgi:membrane-associated phospholipid phosphatase
MATETTQTQPAAHSAEPAPHVPVIPRPRFFFGISLAAGLFFVFWSWLTLYLEATQPFDDGCVDYWHAWTHHHRDLTAMMFFCTDLGSVATMTVLALMGAIWQSAIKHRLLAAAWLGITLGGGFINMTAKDIFQRDRPAIAFREAAVREMNHSYPSGHSMASAVGYGMLGYALILPQRHRPRRVAAILLMLGLVLTVGFSRIYLRAHWFSDVIGGWSVGFCWLFFCIGWLERHRRKQV